MTYKKNFDIFVVHYSKLIERKNKLNNYFKAKGLTVTWVTESDFVNFPTSSDSTKNKLNLATRLLGMDLGINSRTLVFSRKRARFQGYILFIRSFFSKNKKLITGSLPSDSVLDTKWLELQRMHITALELGSHSNFDWILVLEDDAIPQINAFDIANKIAESRAPMNTWINLNSGANLTRTVSDPKPDENRLFKVKPSATKCAVAYLISKDLALKIVGLAKSEGIPNWLPIDVYFQYCLRKFKSISFWQEPPTFLQGSETGEFASGFEDLR